MEISLREWLIIGGILVIVLILFDGWRRINGNRNRLRIDIDPSFSDSDASESGNHFNPELPNGGARPCRNTSVDPDSEQEVAEAPAAEGFRHTRLGAMVQPQALQQKAEQKMEPSGTNLSSNLGANLGAKLKAASSSVLAKAQEKPVEQDRIEPGFGSISDSTHEVEDDQELLPGLEKQQNNVYGTTDEMEGYETELPPDEPVRSEPVQSELVQPEPDLSDESVEEVLLESEEYQEEADEPRERWIYSTDEIPEPQLEITVEPDTPLERDRNESVDLGAEDSDAFFSTELDYEEPVVPVTDALVDDSIEELAEESAEAQFEELSELISEELSDELPEEIPDELLSEAISPDFEEEIPETLSTPDIEPHTADQDNDTEATEEAWVQNLSTPVTHIQDTRALHEMDPLFDDIPPLPRNTVRQTVSQPSQQSIQQPAQSAQPAIPSQKQPEVAAQAPVAEPEKGQNLDLDFDLDQPITMLLGRSRNKRAAMSNATAESGQNEVPAAPEPRKNTRPERKRAQAPSAGAIRDLWADPEPSITLPDIEPEADFTAPVPAQRERQPEEDTPTFAQEAVTEPSFSAPEPVAEATPVQESKPAKKALTDLPEPEHVLVITVVGDAKQPFSGALLRRVVEACGMEHGDMSIFHRFEGSDDTSPVQFSMANAVNPGTFDLEQMDDEETPAVSFFMSMLEPRDPMTAYECMLATAETLAKHVGGDLLDEDRSVMRPQTKEHYRQRIRDFEMENRRQQRVL
ncbi:cell division protein ZipA [Nitrincola alkalilacustris]|uniref:cell division protein ZipA n=1 Tax=Nitrincola alkalilacustris TaxID=1571224 RepID=UPI00124E3DD4|nr:cell division protein ZipA [Nitrincola alkalilacustris]